MRSRAQSEGEAEAMDGARQTRVFSKRSLALELAIVTAASLAVIHVLYAARGIAFINARLSYFVAYILLGVPIVVLWIRKLWNGPPLIICPMRVISCCRPSLPRTGPACG